MAEAEETGDPAATLAEAAKLRGKSGREMLLAELLLRAGGQALSRRQWGLSVQGLEEAYELEKQHGGFPDLRFRITLSLAAVFFGMARYDRARFHAEQALEIACSHFGDDDPRTAIALSTLGSLLLVTNDVSRAEQLMRKALAIDEARLGADHANVATDLNNLAGLLKATNRLAEGLVRRALVIDEASLGSHPKVAADLNNLAQLLKATNRLEEAEPLMRRALAIDQESFGPDHPEVATDLNNLARLLQARNHLLEAEPLMQRALVIDEKSFRPDHPRVATDLNNLALLLNATNRPAEAEPLMRRAWAIDRAAFGPAHPNVAIRLNNLAQLLQDTSRLAEAEPLMRRAVLILMQSLDRHPHPDLAGAIGNYSAMLRDMGRSDAEIDASLDALRREAKTVPASAATAPAGE
jgi:tetratricopeptide (TPR) repeat protein